jgi:hypothetical protein
VRQAVTIMTLILGAILVATPAVLNSVEGQRAPHDNMLAQIDRYAVAYRMIAALVCWFVGCVMIATALVAAFWMRQRPDVDPRKTQK